MSVNQVLWLDCYHAARARSGTASVIESVAPSLARWAKGRGLDVHVVVAPHADDLAHALQPFARIHVKPGVDRGRPSLRHEFTRARIGADVAVTFTNLHVPLLERAAPVVSLLDVIPLEAGAAYVTPSQALRLRLRWQLALHRARAVVALSAASLAAAQKVLGPVHCPTFISHFPATVPSSTTVAVERRHVLSYGGAEPRKNTHVVIDAHRRLPESLRRTFPLVILGGDWRGRSLKTMADNDPWVRLAGQVSDDEHRAILAAAAVVVCPSRLEGFDIPLLDSLAAGAAVIASDIAVHREVAGDAAIFCNVDDVDAFARALAVVLDEGGRDQEHRRHNGVARAKTFTVERQLDAYVGAVEVALKPSR